MGSVCMDANKRGTGLKDAISWLPDEVLSNILSLLPTKLAASTSVLSKKWRNVYALVDNLDFDDSVLLQPEEGKLKRGEIRESFRNFVDRTLVLQRGSPIKKLSLKCHIDEDSEMACMARWICNVAERGVLEVDLSIKPDLELYLPSELYTSKTLVKLTLGTAMDLGKIPRDVSLPALKSLFINCIFFTYSDTCDDLCDVLLPGCPVLEELTIHHDEELVGMPPHISSRSIKKLSVYYNRFGDGRMSFEAPSLVSLDYSDYAVEKYTPVNLESLVEARLDIRYSTEVKKPDLTGLIVGISNIETLQLSPASADVIARCVNHGLRLPVFNNLVSLSFGSFNKRGWKLLPYLLKQSPKLETLTIQGLDGYTGDVIIINMFKVKMLHVLGYRGTAKELHHLKSFLVVTDCLDLVRVEIPGCVVVDDAKVSQLHGDLMALVRAAPVSSECVTQVQVISSSLYIYSV